MGNEQKQQGRKTLVLFDIGAVLLELDYDTFFREAAKLSLDGKSAEKFRAAYTAENLEPNFHTGKINRQDYLSRLEKLINPRKKLSEKKLTELVGMRYKGQIDPVVELKRRLHEAGYAVGLFSNTCEIDVEIVKKRHPEMMDVYEPSNPEIFSFRAGSAKPETPMYEQIRALGFSRVVYIDDKTSYLRTGIEQFGWKGILFTPFIDKAEAMRAVHADETRPSQNFRVANSVDELTEALRYFGVAA